MILVYIRIQYRICLTNHLIYRELPHNFSPCDIKKMFVCHYFWDKQDMECVIEQFVVFPVQYIVPYKIFSFSPTGLYIPKNCFLASYICIHVILSGYTFSRLLNVVIIYLLLFKPQRICQQVQEFQCHITVNLCTMKSYSNNEA